MIRLLLPLMLYTHVRALEVSPEAKNMCIEFETGGQAYYTSSLQRPTVPPGASGVTIGVGYDLGYNTRSQILADWGGLLSDSHVARLQSVSGKTGASARAALGSVRDIIVPWDKATIVYDKRTTPRFVALTEATYPGILNMHPHIQGVMLSTTFNRGSALSPYERRKELVWSRDSILEGNYWLLPGYQLKMRRLWPNIRGLTRRYTAHAALMQRGVDEMRKP